MNTKLALALLLGMCAIGCIARDDGALTAAEAKAAGDALGNGLENAVATYGPMTSSGADSTCVTLSGDTSDPDGDAIPTSAKLAYDCTSQALGFSGQMTGTRSVVDDQPQTAAWAFTADADLHSSLTGPGGGSITSDWNGTLVGTQPAALGPFALERTLAVVTVFQTGGADPKSTTVTEDNDWTVTFTPEATWTPGGVIVTGSLAATGSWNVTVGAASFAATLSTPTPLTVTPSCKTLLTAGVVTGTYPLEGGGTGTVTVTWTGCGQRRVTQTP